MVLGFSRKTDRKQNNQPTNLHFLIKKNLISILKSELIKKTASNYNNIIKKKEVNKKYEQIKIKTTTRTTNTTIQKQQQIQK